MVYAPRIVLEEIDDLKTSENLASNKDAWGNLVQHARVGREVERISRLDFFGKKKRGRGIL